MRRGWLVGPVLGLAACGGEADWDPAWIALEDDVLALVNEARAAGGTCAEQSFPPSEPLVMDALLRDVARAFSQAMAEEEFFDHVDPAGDDPFDRMTAAGFDGALPWGENIAAGYVDAETVMDGWLASPGHCANLLEPGYGAVGIGYFFREDDPSLAKHFWTQDFAGSPQR
jgi:uncharacterized protein YkwD